MNSTAQREINPKKHGHRAPVAEALTIDDVRALAASHRIFTFTKLAELVPCARPTIYFAIERPKRYPKVFRRIQELIHA